MAEFIYTVGAGQTYTTVQAAWNAIPSSIPAEDTHIIRLMVGTYWTVSVLIDPASPRPQTPAEMGSNASTGVTGKWRYAPDLDAFIGLQHNTDGNVWAFKPAQWQDPRTAA